MTTATLLILKQTFQSLVEQTAALETATHTCSGTCKQEIDRRFLGGGCFLLVFFENFLK